MAKLRGTAPTPMGGRYGANFEELTDDTKTLTPNVDPIYQFFTVGGAGGGNRIVTLATANAKKGDRFYISNDEDGRNTFYIELNPPGGAYPLDRVYTQMKKEVIFDGTDWVGAEVGTNYIGVYGNIAIGYLAGAVECSVAIGMGAQTATPGAYAYQDSVAIGYRAIAQNRALALGYSADSQYDRSTALGYNSWCTRTCELAINIAGQATQNGAIVIGGWWGEMVVSDGTPLELHCGGEPGQEWTIREESSLAFNLMVTARDNTSGDAGTWMYRGLIKRDDGDNTVLVDSSSYYVYKENPAMDCTIAADDTKESLAITVTGQSGNYVYWAARLDEVEVVKRVG